MRRLTFLLRPGWVALAVVVIAFTYLCFSVLAPWQLGKNTKTSRENNQIAQSLTTAPVPLKTLLPAQDSSAPDAQWRRVTATGHYLPDKQLLVRLRVADGDPALEVLLPFVVDGGPTVLVDRGYVRPEQGSRVPPIPPPPRQTVTITARLRDPEPPVLDKESFISGGVRQVYSIDVRQIAALTGVPLAGSYLQLVDNQPGGLGVIGVPHLDAGPFLSYGIQWITFGVVAPILLGYFVYAEVRVRRAENAAARAIVREVGEAPESPAASTALTEPAKPVTVEEKLADRYGRRR
jgi:cytochrome oxidase assembly protein ShyY1